MSMLESIIAAALAGGSGGAGGSVGGSSVQPDWNQNDETAPDFVKNRPFWTDDPVETVLFDGAVTLSDGWNDGDLLVEIVAGTEYTVTFDGTVYVLTSQVDSYGDVFIGNPYYWNLVEYADQDNGLPFIIGCGWVGANVDNGDYTLKVIGNIAEAHKIDSKYLDLTSIENAIEVVEDAANEAKETADGAKELIEKGHYVYLETNINVNFREYQFDIGGSLTYDLSTEAKVKFRYSETGGYVDIADLVKIFNWVEYARLVKIKFGIESGTDSLSTGFFAINAYATFSDTYNYRVYGIVGDDVGLYKVSIFCTADDAATITITRVL